MQRLVWKIDGVCFKEMWETLEGLEWEMVLQSIVKESILKNKRGQWQQVPFCRKNTLKDKSSNGQRDYSAVLQAG